MRSLSLTQARQLAVMSQQMAGERPRSTRAGILQTVRGLRLFEYRAFIHPTEDYPLHEWRMRYFGRGETAWPRRVRAFMERNRTLRRDILSRLRREGPLLSRQFEDRAVTSWRSSGWTSGRNVSLMLEFLAAKGLIMVAGRQDGQRLWDLTERCLPAWTPRARLTEREFSRRVAERVLLSMGVDRIATPRWWGTAPTRGVRIGPAAALTELEWEGRVEPVQIRTGGGRLPGRWYLAAGALPILERLERGAWKPRTTLLSPFDSLIIDRTRTESLFGFRYRMEIYVPKAKRQYGYFVMPILHGDRLIGRDRSEHGLRAGQADRQRGLRGGGRPGRSRRGAGRRRRDQGTGSLPGCARDQVQSQGPSGLEEGAAIVNEERTPHVFTNLRT